MKTINIERMVNEYVLELCDKKDEYIVQRCLEDLKNNRKKYGKILEYNTLTRERLKEIILHGLKFEEMLKSDTSL